MKVDGSGPVIVNAGQTAYMRVLYPLSSINALSRSMGRLGSADQLGTLYDAWALGQSGYAPITGYLELARGLPADADPVVLRQVVNTMSTVEGAFDGLPKGDPGRVAFNAFALKVLRPVGDRLGWDAKPNEDPNASSLRNSVLIALGAMGDEQVKAEARRRFERMLQTPQEVAPAVRRTAMAIVARDADSATLDKMIALLKSTQDALEKQNIFRALTRVADPAGAERVLQLAIGPDAPSGTMAAILAGAAYAHPDLVWNFALEHAEQIQPLVDSETKLTMMPAIAGSSDDLKRAAELEAWGEKNLPAGAREELEAAVATIHLNAKFKAERIPEIEAWLKTN